MEEINALFSANLKRLRAARRMSLDEVSRLSGVSKSMLGQIERGEVNPTISTVWKIASGLKVPYSQLLSRPQSECEPVHISNIRPIEADEGRYRNYLLFPMEEGRRFEVLYIEIDAGGGLKADAHPQGTQEFITVFSGTLRVCLDDGTLATRKDEAIQGREANPHTRTTVETHAGGAVRFAADRPHSYACVGEETCRLSMIIYYPG